MTELELSEATLDRLAALRDVPEVRELMRWAERRAECQYVADGIRDEPPESCACDGCRLAAALRPFQEDA